MRSGHCPFCGGTDIGDTVEGKGICLDCDREWTPKPMESAVATDLTSHVQSMTLSVGKLTSTFKVFTTVLIQANDPHRNERCSAETNEAFVKKVLQSVTPPC